MTHRDHIEQLITKDQIKQAIDEFMNGVTASNQHEMRDSLIILSSQFVGNETDRNNSLVSTESYRMHKAKIIKALTSLLNEYKPSSAYIWNTSNADQAVKTKNNQDYIIANIAKLIDKSYDVTSLQYFCMLHFDKVYSNLAPAQSKIQHIMALIGYCKQFLKFDELLSLIKAENPEQYRLYEPYTN